MIQKRKINKLLIANRGEIACRVIRTCRKLGIKTVAVYSEIERDALHVQMADESACLGPAPSRESYLRGDKIIEVCKQLGVDAIHPGYGFLSEKDEFATLCAKNNIIFVGPRPESMLAMGDKTRARQSMIKAKVPVVPGTEDAITDPAAALELAKTFGFPVMLKAAAGGGGKGMRLVHKPEDFIKSFEGAAREAQNAFSDNRVYFEKYVVKPRHVEIQIFGDQHGNVISLNERECSVQRRHQKVIEESPSPFITAETRRKMGEAAVKAGKAVNYVGAGTCEFLVDAEQNFYFLEMNTRLQVEHPVSEYVTGLDFVELQIRVAEGEPLPLKQEDVQQKGWAIEARIYAEDAWQNFMPSPGKIQRLVLPQSKGDIRLDIGVYEGYTIPMEYDPMIGKLIVYGTDRPEAIAKMQKVLSECAILGIQSNLPFLRVLMDNAQVQAGDFDTGWLDRVNLMEGVELAETDRRAGEVAALILAFESQQLQNAHRDGARLSDWQLAFRED